MEGREHSIVARVMWQAVVLSRLLKAVSVAAEIFSSSHMKCKNRAAMSAAALLPAWVVGAREKTSHTTVIQNQEEYSFYTKPLTQDWLSFPGLDGSLGQRRKTYYFL